MWEYYNLFASFHTKKVFFIMLWLFKEVIKEKVGTEKYPRIKKNPQMLIFISLLKSNSCISFVGDKET